MVSNGMGDRGRDGGFSLVEVIIAATIVIVMVYVVTSLSISGTEAQKYSERINRVTEINQEIAEEMRTDLVSSVRIFTNDAIGTTYSGLLQRGTMPPPIAARLPTLESTGTFRKDVLGTEKTGNQLMFAKHAWTDRFRCAGSGKVYRFDVYRMIQYYLSRDGAGPRVGSNIGINLCKFVSEPMVDGQQIDQVTVAADLTEVLGHLWNRTPDMDGETHPRVELVWRLGQDPATPNTLRQILSTAVLSSTSVAPRNGTWEMVADTKLSVPGMLGYRHFSVATNYAKPSMGVARFALPDNTGAGFPHGFELQLIGPSSARQVLLHLSLVSTNANGHPAFSQQQSIADARDI